MAQSGRSLCHTCDYLKRPEGSSRSFGSGVPEVVCCLIESRGGAEELE